MSVGRLLLLVAALAVLGGSVGGLTFSDAVVLGFAQVILSVYYI